MGASLANSVLQFIGYQVDRIHLELPVPDLKTREYQILPTFAMSLKNVDDGNHQVTLSISITSTAANPAPFNLEIAMTGCFSLTMEQEDDELKQTLLRENTVAIMFPFLRSIVASVTSAANITPLVIPVINLAQAFKSGEFTVADQ